MPAAVRNVLRAERYTSEGGIKTKRGDFIVDDLSSGELFAQAFGFTSSNYTFALERNARNKRVERSIVEQRTKLHRRMYQAMTAGDHGMYREALKDITRYNRKHPQYPVTPDSVRRSVKQHYKTTAEMYDGVTINKALRGVIEESNAEYSKGPDLFN